MSTAVLVDCQDKIPRMLIAAGISNRAWTICLANVVAFALLSRIIVAVALPLDARYEGDAVEYVSVAEHVLDLGVFGEVPGVPYATIPPGYPLFIAVIFRLANRNLLAVRLVQALISGVTVWLLGRFARMIIGSAGGLLAATALALCPPCILWPSLYLTETLYTLIVVAFLYAFVILVSSQETTWGLHVATGALLGLSLLTREVLFLFPLLLPVVLRVSGFSWGKGIRVSFVVVAAAFVVIAPWLCRNRIAFGTPFMTERIEAIRYQLTGSGYLSPRYRYLADQMTAPKRKKTPEFYEAFGQSPTELLHMNRVLSKPGMHLGILRNRIEHFWFYPNGLASIPRVLGLRLLYRVVHVLVLALAMVGITFGLMRRQPTSYLFLALLLYVTAVGALISWPHPRYTLPFLPVVFTLAASGAGCLGRSLRQFTRRGKLASSGSGVELSG